MMDPFIDFRHPLNPAMRMLREAKAPREQFGPPMPHHCDLNPCTDVTLPAMLLIVALFALIFYYHRKDFQ